MADTKPLWQVMHDAWYQAMITHQPSCPAHNIYAAELRAIAHEVHVQGLEGGVTGPVAQWLLDEADRAERGEAGE